MAGREITVYIYKYNPILNETINEIDDVNGKNEDIKKEIIYYKEDEEIILFGMTF